MSPIPAFDILGLPAPVWFLLALKVFGFWVHMIFMGLWFAGLLVGLLLLPAKGPMEVAGKRLLKGMPVFIAFGVNAGIVPLLFIQVLYPQFFYTSTILQAWYWFFVIVLLILAYYGIYLYVLNIEKPERRGLALTAGWIAALLFLFLGLVFSSEMQLLVSPDRWADYTLPAVGGAVTGGHLALNGTAFQRYIMVFGLSLSTVAAYLVFDLHILRRNKELSPENLRALVVGLTFLGIVIFGAAALPYLRTIGVHLKDQPLWKYLAGLGPILAFVGGILYYLSPGKGMAILLILLQALSLLFNAVARQIVQVRELAPYVKLSELPLRVQISPILLFLITLVIGLAVLAWLIKVFVEAGQKEPAAG